MKKTFIFSFLILIITSCANVEQDKKIKELEGKLNEQSEKINNQKIELLEKELKEKEAELNKVKTSSNNSQFYAKGYGRFPEASNRILSYNDISHLDKYSLKIMRNEIFARYGYVFKTSDMIQYFSGQNWYRPLYNDVTSKLSEIEKSNISFIKQFE